MRSAPRDDRGAAQEPVAAYFSFSAAGDIHYQNIFKFSYFLR
jgi:hypothetical protein